MFSFEEKPLHMNSKPKIMVNKTGGSTVSPRPSPRAKKWVKEGGKEKVAGTRKKGAAGTSVQWVNCGFSATKKKNVCRLLPEEPGLGEGGGGTRPIRGPETSMVRI